MSDQATFDGFKSAIVFDQNEAQRMLIRDTIKELGVTEVSSTDTSLDVVKTLRAAETAPDWVICAFITDESPNAFQILKTLLEDPKFSKTRTSLILEHDSRDILPAAYDLGLLSHHFLPFNKSDLTSSLKSLMSDLSENYDEHCLVAANFLRSHLIEDKHYEDLVALNENLISIFPSHPELFLSLAESQHLSGNLDEAKKTLHQAKYLGASLDEEINKLHELMNPEGSESEEPNTIAETFGLKSIMVVEPDETFAKHLGDSLSNLGEIELNIFNDGEEAATWIEANEEPSIILQEWKIPNVSGPALIQRVRQKGFVSVPIVVISNLVTKDDAPLLKEIGVETVVRKPTTQEEIIRQLMTVIRKKSQPKGPANMEREIRLLIEADKNEDAKKLYQRFKKLANVPANLTLAVEAQISYIDQEYAQAKEQALEAFRGEGEAVVLLNLLGKIFLKLKDHESALKCLNRANSMSSNNLMRLCMLAETQSMTGDSDAAQESIDKAKNVDSENEIVKVTDASIALSSGSPAAKKLIAGLDKVTQIVAFMNNRAVLLSSNDDIDKSIELYNNALGALPEKLGKEKDIIRYNLALAYVKNDQYEESKKSLEELKKSKNPDLAKKALSLQRKLTKSIKAGEKITLNISPDQGKPEAMVGDAPEPFRKPLAFHAKPKDLCLHMIYSGGDLFNDTIKAYLTSTEKKQQQAA